MPGFCSLCTSCFGYRAIEKDEAAAVGGHQTAAVAPAEVEEVQVTDITDIKPAAVAEMIQSSSIEKEENKSVPESPAETEKNPEEVIEKEPLIEEENVKTVVDKLPPSSASKLLAVLSDHGHVASSAEDDSGVIDEFSRLEPDTTREELHETILSSAAAFDADRVQLTVSSVNTILEDLPETEEEAQFAKDFAAAIAQNPSTKAKAPAKATSWRQLSVEGAAGMSSSSRGKRERSPVIVSFRESPTVLEPEPRQRSRSDATSRYFKFRSPSSSISSAKGKISWLRDRRKSAQGGLGTGGTPAVGKVDEETEAEGGRDEMVGNLEAITPATSNNNNNGTTNLLSKSRFKKSPVYQDSIDRPPKNPRPRTKSDKLDRTTRKSLLTEVSRSAAFDWPLGRLGKLRQKVQKRQQQSQKQKDLRSTSEVALSEINRGTAARLRRRNSERNKGRGVPGGGASLRVAFANEDEGIAASLWRFFWDKGKSAGGGKSYRRRHMTDPHCKRKIA